LPKIVLPNPKTNFPGSEDHAGVSNAQLVKEEAELASKYNNKSVLEQNSLDIAWSILMEDRYNELRACVAESEKELVHFRRCV